LADLPPVEFVGISFPPWGKQSADRNFHGLVSPLLESSGPEKKEDNQDDQTYASQGIKTPLLAVPPNRQDGHEGDDEKYRENERQHGLRLLLLRSGFGPKPFSIGAICRPANRSSHMRIPPNK
jgi:hypothetical protein